MHHDNHCIYIMQDRIVEDLEGKKVYRTAFTGHYNLMALSW